MKQDLPLNVTPTGVIKPLSPPIPKPPVVVRRVGPQRSDQVKVIRVSKLKEWKP